MSAQSVARRFVNAVDRVGPAPHVPVPGMFSITKIEPVRQESVDFREKHRPVGAFWQEFNDLMLGDLAGLSRRGDCE